MSKWLRNCLSILAELVFLRGQNIMDLYIQVKYYDGIDLGKMRSEKAIKFDNECRPSREARRIIVDSTNELREIGLPYKKGPGWKYVHPLRSPENQIVAVIFKGGNSSHPCLTPQKKKSILADGAACRQKA